MDIRMGLLRKRQEWTDERFRDYWRNTPWAVGGARAELARVLAERCHGPLTARHRLCPWIAGLRWHLAT